MALLGSFADSDVLPVSNNPDPGDSAIVVNANADERTIVTRDEGFPNRRICTIDQGVLFIPQRVTGVPLKIPDTFDCLNRLLGSGRIDDMGHRVCTVLPDGVEMKTRDGKEFIPFQDI